jgi:hypothetical protein
MEKGNAGNREKRKKAHHRKKIQEILPPENIRAYLNIYHAMKKIDLKAAIDATMQSFPLKSAEKISLELFDMQKSGWLSKDECATLLRMNLRVICNAQGGRSAVRARLRSRIMPQGAPKDYALTFLVYALDHDIRCKTGKRGIHFITEFLYEQNILSQYAEYDEIKKRCDRTSPEEVVSIFLYFSVASRDFCAQAFKGIDTEKYGPSLHKAFCSDFIAYLLWNVLPYVSTEGIEETDREKKMCPITRPSLKNRT